MRIQQIYIKKKYDNYLYNSFIPLLKNYMYVFPVGACL